jgi:predicted ATPase with chaperone activity
MSSRHGSHHLLPLGPPGASTSRLARRRASILPAMRLAKALETTPIPRVAGLTGGRTAFMTAYPPSVSIYP